MDWFERQLANTNIVILVIFSLCCQPIPLILGIIGVITCQHPVARQNAKIMLIMSAVLFALQMVGAVFKFILR